MADFRRVLLPLISDAWHCVLQEAVASCDCWLNSMQVAIFIDILLVVWLVIFTFILLLIVIHFWVVDFIILIFFVNMLPVEKTSSVKLILISFVMIVLVWVRLGASEADLASMIARIICEWRSLVHVVYRSFIQPTSISSCMQSSTQFIALLIADLMIVFYSRSAINAWPSLVRIRDPRVVVIKRWVHDLRVLQVSLAHQQAYLLSRQWYGSQSILRGSQVILDNSPRSIALACLVASYLIKAGQVVHVVKAAQYHFWRRCLAHYLILVTSLISTSSWITEIVAVRKMRSCIV